MINHRGVKCGRTQKRARRFTLGVPLFEVVPSYVVEAAKSLFAQALWNGSRRNDRGAPGKYDPERGGQRGI